MTSRFFCAFHPHSRSHNPEKRHSVLDALAVFHIDFRYRSVEIALDLVHQLHSFHDSQHLAFFHRIADLYKGRLCGGGGRVECADNGEAALSRYQNMPDYYYDMIFMDLNMPIMDGYEAAKSIRGSKKPDASDIPILAVTANAMAKDIVKVHEAGMNERITKPVQRELLYQTMEKYIL